jgi:hypothetical protein
MTKSQPLLMPEGKIPPEISPETELIEYQGEIWAFYDGMPITPLGKRRGLPNEYCHPEPNYRIGRCKMIKTDGNRCRNPVRTGWNVCPFHGAGRELKPGGKPPTTGRFSKHLPTRFLEEYEAQLNDPEYLTLTNEMALVDSRVAELLTMLDGADTRVAWAKIRGVAYQLSVMSAMPANTTIEEFKAAIDTQKQALYEAIAIRTQDHELWDSIKDMVEQRRKLADTERRRILDARKYLTLTEANAMLAFVVDAVMKNVSSGKERLAIAEQFKKLNSGSVSLLPQPQNTEAELEPDIIDMEMEDDIQEGI